MNRRLSLRKESLAPLETDELSQVVGALPWTPWCVFIIGLQERIDEMNTTTNC